VTDSAFSDSAGVSLRLAAALESTAAAMQQLADAIASARPGEAPRPTASAFTAVSAVAEPSGPRWCERFPTSRSLDDLAEPFRTGCQRFIAALRGAGATVSIAATVRPRERAYLMHWSWQIARNHVDPREVPAMPGVDIAWVHVDAAGVPDLVASRGAARTMVERYSMIALPALESRHTQRRAIDMSIRWAGALTIGTSDGSTETITGPANGSNPALHQVGRGYGVVKLVTDPPHWSDDGN
jgi:hypothetical protein